MELKNSTTLQAVLYRALDQAHSFDEVEAIWIVGENYEVLPVAPQGWWPECEKIYKDKGPSALLDMAGKAFAVEIPTLEYQFLRLGLQDLSKADWGLFERLDCVERIVKILDEGNEGYEEGWNWFWNVVDKVFKRAVKRGATPEILNGLHGILDCISIPAIDFIDWLYLVDHSLTIMEMESRHESLCVLAGETLWYLRHAINFAKSRKERVSLLEAVKGRAPNGPFDTEYFELIHSLESSLLESPRKL